MASGNDGMRVTVLSDDYFFSLGMKAMLSREYGNGLLVQGRHFPRYGQIRPAYFQAGLFILSFSSLGRVLEILSAARHPEFKALIFTPVRCARLLNFNCIAKKTGMAEIVKELDRVLSRNWGEAMSPREFLVLSLLLKGVTMATIANMLAITEKTVSQHKMNGLRKLGFERLGQLI